MLLERDLWLSEILGYDAFRVSLRECGMRSAECGVKDRLTPLKSAIRTRQSTIDQRAFYYAKVPTQQVEVVQALGALGFHVVDVNITLSLETRDLRLGKRLETRGLRLVGSGEDQPLASSLQPHLLQPLASSLQSHTLSVMVQDVVPVHYGAVLDIAGSCFLYSRFHLDPHIAEETAHAIKRAWVQSYLEKIRGERLLVGLLDGKAVGFLAVLATTVNGEPCRVIDLIGVDTAAQGRGVGKALVGCFLEQYAGLCPVVRVGTQAANIPSLRLYESSGFRVHETTYVLHAHVGMGGTLS